MYLFLCESRSTGDPYVGLDCVELLSSIYRSKRDQGIRTEQKSLKIWDKKKLTQHFHLSVYLPLQFDRLHISAIVATSYLY